MEKKFLVLNYTTLKKIYPLPNIKNFPGVTENKRT